MRQKRALLPLSRGAIAQPPGKSGIFSQVHEIYFLGGHVVIVVVVFFSASQIFPRVPSGRVGASFSHSINKHCLLDVCWESLCCDASWASVIQEHPFLSRGVK